MISRTICSRVASPARRGLHMSAVSRTEGAVANSKAFGQKEKAVENQWAHSHEVELLQSLKAKLAEQEKATAELKTKLSELEAKHKK